MKRFMSNLFLAWVAVLVVAGCGQPPKRVLNRQEKRADLAWLYSKIRELYAPLKYKEERYKFDFEKEARAAMKEADAATTNEQFYLIVHRLLAKFKDAHVSMTFAPTKIPGRSQVAYLGFDGERRKDGLVITKLLPSLQGKSSYPLQEGDIIKEVDGKKLTDVVKTELLPYKDLGEEEASLTHLMPKLFNRISTNLPMPTAANVTLKYERNEKTYELKLPWIVRDLYTFTKEQAEAQEEINRRNQTPQQPQPIEPAMKLFVNGLRFLNQQFDIKASDILSVKETKSYRFWDNFAMLDVAPTWTSKRLARLLGAAPDKDAKTTLMEERFIPRGASFIGGKQYPAYVFTQPVLDADGKPKGKKRIGYVRIDSFSPKNEKKALEEITGTVNALHTFGVHDVIVDLLDNGGGSLKLGSQMAQLFSSRRLDLPEIEFKVSDRWESAFTELTVSGETDSERELGRRVSEELEKAREEKRHVTKRLDVDHLFPFQVQPNVELEDPFSLTLLVDERCASMCDIFTAAMKDNKIAENVIGARTMGAGGNVDASAEAPNSHFVVNLTESLIVRSNGKYVENEGVTPDIEFDLHESAKHKYESLIEKAAKTIVAK